MYDFDDICEQDNIPVEAVKTAKDSLEVSRNDSDAYGILLQNVDSPNWEVRKVIAEAILYMPEERIWPFRKLLTDSNVYVRNAAKTACERRNLFMGTVEKNRQISNALLQSSNGFEEKFGAEAADWARREVEKAYDITVGAAAHDVYGILSPMKDYVSAIENIANDPLRVQDIPTISMYVQKLRGRIETIERLITDMRTLAKATSPVRRCEQVRDVVNSAHMKVLDIFKSKCRDVSMIDCSLVIPEKLSFRVSRLDMERVFYNLIKNAYEAFLVKPGTFRSGTIQITAEETMDGCIAVGIHDTGMGMTDEDLETYLQFNPGVTSKKDSGTGFGLAIAFKRIRDHRGTLGVTSKFDCGTTVKVIIPKEPVHE